MPESVPECMGMYSTEHAVHLWFKNLPSVFHLSSLSCCFVSPLTVSNPSGRQLGGGNIVQHHSVYISSLLRVNKPCSFQCFNPQHCFIPVARSSDLSYSSQICGSNIYLSVFLSFFLSHAYTSHHFYILSGFTSPIQHTQPNICEGK